jgi:hypothetical protein
MQAFGMTALTAVAGTALLVLMGCSSESSQPHTESGPKRFMIGDGTFRVGTDIEPGTYRSDGNLDGSCQ